MTDWESKVSRADYFKKLADELPADLENRDELYKAYMEHIKKILAEKEWDW